MPHRTGWKHKKYRKLFKLFKFTPFLQCYKLQSDSFKIVSDLCLIKAVDTHYHHDWSVLFFFQKNKCSP